MAMCSRRSSMLLALALMVATSTLACSRTDQRCRPLDSDGTPIDASLMAFLSRARAAHHLADLREETEPALAIESLGNVVDGPVPEKDGTMPAEVREVIADTQARVAELQSRLLEFELASARIDKALLLVPDISYFRGHLFETRGIVEQRRADELRKRGEGSAAETARLNALAAFETAMQIQAEVIRRTPADASTNPTSRASGPSNDDGQASPTPSSNQGIHR